MDDRVVVPALSTKPLVPGRFERANASSSLRDMWAVATRDLLAAPISRINRSRRLAAPRSLAESFSASLSPRVTATSDFLARAFDLLCGRFLAARRYLERKYKECD